MNHPEPTEPAHHDARFSILRRPGAGRVLAGVAGAIADRFGLEVTTVRLAFAVLAICGGAGVPLYLAGWLLIPAEGTDTSIAQGVTGMLRWN